MNSKKQRQEKMQELYELKKSYSKSNPKPYAKISDALVITNDRLNTLVLTFGIIACSVFLGIITR